MQINLFGFNISITREHNNRAIIDEDEYIWDRRYGLLLYLDNISEQYALRGLPKDEYIEFINFINRKIREDYFDEKNLKPLDPLDTDAINRFFSDHYLPFEIRIDGDKISIKATYAAKEEAYKRFHENNFYDFLTYFEKYTRRHKMDSREFLQFGMVFQKLFNMVKRGYPGRVYMDDVKIDHINNLMMETTCPFAVEFSTKKLRNGQFQIRYYVTKKFFKE